MTCSVAFLLLACHKPGGTILGKAPRGDLSSVLSIRAGDTPPQVVLQGIMVEKCPVSGCWIRVQDSTGTILVDTKNSGFVAVNVPLQSTVTVAGKVVSEGDEVVLEASGLRY